MFYRLFLNEDSKVYYLFNPFRDYKNTEAYVGMFSQIGELYNVKVIKKDKNFSNMDKLCLSQLLF